MANLELQRVSPPSKLRRDCRRARVDVQRQFRSLRQSSEQKLKMVPIKVEEAEEEPVSILKEEPTEFPDGLDEK